MKKCFYLILVLLAFVPTANAEWVLSLYGKGTKDNPYMVDGHVWYLLCQNVQEGFSYKGKYFKLRNDITIPGKDYMLGDLSHPFCGIFDGDGHQIELNIDAFEQDYIAPFRCIRGATIKNLLITGNIKAGRYAGALVAYASGKDNHIINCRSNVTFTFNIGSGVTYYATSSGGLGGVFDGDKDASLYIENCLFDGRMKSRYRNVHPGMWGGFVGWLTGGKGHVYITNSLFAPTEVQSLLTSNGNWRCFVYGNENNMHLTNCYYKNPGITIEDKQKQGSTSATYTSQYDLRLALGGAWKADSNNGVIPVMNRVANTIIPYAGAGTNVSPYQINSEADWKTLVFLINNGYENFESKFLKLTTDITLTETHGSGNSTVMAGISTSNSTKFRGTFDGDNHTITLAITDNSDDNYCAPFRYIKDATIKNLHVAGSINKQNAKNAGGLVGKAEGSNNIRDCRSSVEITIPTSRDASSGGFIGELRNGNTTNITNCVFDGKLLGSQSYKWGGFIGWVADDNKAVFSNCLFAPTEVNVNDNDNRTFARRKDGDDLTFINCYYTQSLGSTQGKEARTISGSVYSNNTTVTVTPDGTAETGGSNIKLTAYNLDGINFNPCIMYDGALYSGNGNQVKLSLAQNGMTPEGYCGYSFIATPSGNLSGVTSPFTLTMPNSNVTITLSTSEWAGLGSSSTPYLIYTAGQWDLLANRVNGGTGHTQNSYNGKYFKLMADISVNTMVGNSESNSFNGTFDGNGHTLTFSYTDNSSDNFCDPFRYINGATIKKLHVAGTIVKSNGKNAGGLVGFAKGDNTITSCRSSVDIQFNKDDDVSSGGFIGEMRYGGTTTFTDCLFDGKLQGENANCWGDFIGWVAKDSGNTATFNNCLFNPALVNIDLTDNDDNSKTFARKDSDNNAVVTIDNGSYYKTFIKDDQGATDARTGYTNEALRYALGDGWEIVTVDNVEKVVPIMRLYTFDGNGTQGNPYVIASADDWNHLASNVALGEYYSGKYFQLASSISVSRMVGTVNDASTTIVGKAFKGIFDGEGNTLTFNYTPTDHRTAPFRFVDGAKIWNLHVAGTITTAYNAASGLICYAIGNTEIKNCRSSITINCTREYYNDVNGGFISNIFDGTTTITGCLFDGILIGVRNSSGFVGQTGGSGYANASMQINDCLYASTSVNPGDNCATFYRYTIAANCQINNSYYTQTFGIAQGKLLRSITAGQGIDLEGFGTVTPYDVSGITGYLKGIMYDSVLYAGNEDEVWLKLSLEEGYSFTSGSFIANNGAATLTSTENHYTLTMPDENVIITANTVYTPWSGSGTENDPYQICTPAQLDSLATRVNNGNSYNGYYFKLMNDLVYIDSIENNYTTIGRRVDLGVYRTFEGHFDGDDNTISGIRIYKGGNNDSDSFQGLFGYLNGTTAEVKNLTLDNAVITGYQRVGGIVGYLTTASVTNCHVTSSVIIRTVRDHACQHGGIVGYNHGTVSHCTSAATLTIEVENYTNCSAYGGIAGDNDYILIDNFACGDTIPAATDNYYGAIAGKQSETQSPTSVFTRNYYANCYVAGVGNAINVGCKNADITDDFGAVPGNVRTVTGYGESPVNPSDKWAFIASPLTENPAPNNVSGLLGTEISTGQYDFDLYRFNQNADHEWENYHQHNPDTSRFLLINGKGYLYAKQNDATLIFNGDFNMRETATMELAYDENATLKGYNLVGNPFPRAAWVNKLYYKMNGSGTGIEAVSAYQTTAIPPCTGIMVEATSADEALVFSTMPPAQQNANNGNLQITLAQANQTRGASEALLDNAIVSFNEGSQLGKFYFGRQNANIYLPQGGKDYAIVSVSAGTDVARNVSTTNEVPVSFKAKKDGTYTITVNPEGVELDYMHLIDNLTGADVDLLASPSYTFTAKTTDYASRFRLVFSANGNADGDDAPFAFVSNGNIIINGEGTLQVIDVMGRVIVSRGGHIQCVLTSGMTPGVYVLRLINGDDVKVQKIVIE